MDAVGRKRIWTYLNYFHTNYLIIHSDNLCPPLITHSISQWSFTKICYKDTTFFWYMQIIYPKIINLAFLLYYANTPCLNASRSLCWRLRIILRYRMKLRQVVRQHSGLGLILFWCHILYFNSFAYKKCDNPFRSGLPHFTYYMMIYPCISRM